MVSSRGHVAPPDAYRGEKRVSSKPLNRSRNHVSNVIQRVKSKGHMWKGKVDGQSNHLETLVWVLFVHEMPGEHCQKTDLKAHHLKSMAKRDKSLSLQGISSVAHD
jgi:hypothetical protein